MYAYIEGTSALHGHEKVLVGYRRSVKKARTGGEKNRAWPVSTVWQINERNEPELRFAPKFYTQKHVFPQILRNHGLEPFYTHIAVCNAILLYFST